MTILSRLDVVCLSALGMVLILPVTSVAGQVLPIVEQHAKTYGLESFGQVEAIRYTFNAQFPGMDISRSWVWEPKADRVTYEGKDKSGQPVKVTYLRSELGSQSVQVKEEIDPGFINDQYWLLLPFHVAWDGAAVEHAGSHKLPLGEGSAEKVVVKYAADSGYSPGDTWELYLGSEGRIEELVFRRGGSAKPSIVVATWADHKKAGPLLFSLDRPATADGKPVRTYFSNVAVKLVGANTWLDAQ